MLPEVSRALSAVRVAYLLLNNATAHIVFIAVWNYGSFMEFVAVRINESPRTKRNLIY
jgi:hypothetical protein